MDNEGNIIVLGKISGQSTFSDGEIIDGALIVALKLDGNTGKLIWKSAVDGTWAFTHGDFWFTDAIQMTIKRGW